MKSICPTVTAPSAFGRAIDYLSAKSRSVLAAEITVTLTESCMAHKSSPSTRSTGKP